jgi:hypothetical protein
MQELEKEEQVVCQICGQAKDLDEVWPGELIREGIIATIKKNTPNGTTMATSARRT